ncbi:transcriptional repressor [Agrobacterium tumefaciens]|uniref:Ferric uptake regulation protein n=1 Tax=Agrobacterium tumefaciens TaxID=358 RepID=A0AAE6BCF8_AGRTU|nr:transcriptional repressor [Agrobacterium tumefaciens]QCL80351.1 transcriptional repressor [Agrobacterium tumefaciens]
MRTRAALKRVGLRPTRQRIVLGGLLFRGEHRHFTADDLHRETTAAGTRLSLATVYNTLNQFAEAGFVRRVCIEGGRTYFDTDTANHQHFYVEAEDRIIDIPAGRISLGMLPEPPEGYVIDKVDILLRLVRLEPEKQAPRGCGAVCRGAPERRGLMDRDLK